MNKDFNTHPGNPFYAIAKMTNGHHGKTRRGRGRPASRLKYIRRNYTDIILIGLVIVLSIISGFYFGSAYGFNMTQDLQKEERIVQACIAFNIEAVECEVVYGGTPGDGIITDEDAKGLELK